MKQKKNQGFSLVEIIVIVSIMAILLGIMVPSLNSVLGFQAQRATQSIAAALDHMKIEAMSRLVGEMKLEYRGDGYYVTYYLDRGKGSSLPTNGSGTDGGDQPEKIAERKVQISYLDSAGVTHNLKDEGEALILTVDRERGSYRPIQNALVTKDEMHEFLMKDNKKDLSFHDGAVDCRAILVTCGMRSRTITLNKDNATYEVTAN